MLIILCDVRIVIALMFFFSVCRLTQAECFSAHTLLALVSYGHITQTSGHLNRTSRPCNAQFSCIRIDACRPPIYGHLNCTTRPSSAQIAFVFVCGRTLVRSRQARQCLALFLKEYDCTRSQSHIFNLSDIILFSINSHRRNSLIDVWK